MAGMDLRLRRADRGVSVFWMILVLGVAVFLLLAIVLIVGEREIDTVGGEGPTAHVAEPAATVAEDEPVPGTSSFGEGSTADVAPVEEGELPGERLEPDVEPAPEAGEEVGEGPIEEEIPEVAEETEDEDVVIDPNDTQQAVVPTPSGPEARDDETILEDEDSLQQD